MRFECEGQSVTKDTIMSLFDIEREETFQKFLEEHLTKGFIECNGYIIDICYETKSTHKYVNIYDLVLHDKVFKTSDYQPKKTTFYINDVEHKLVEASKVFNIKPSDFKKLVKPLISFTLDNKKVRVRTNHRKLTMFKVESKTTGEIQEIKASVLSKLIDKSTTWIRSRVRDEKPVDVSGYIVFKIESR